jgi:hypothetical protein
MHIRVCLTNLDLYLPDTVSDLREYIKSCGVDMNTTEIKIDKVKCFGHCYPCSLGLCAEIDGRPVLLYDDALDEE